MVDVTERGREILEAAEALEIEYKLENIAPGARAYVARNDEWSILVAEFSIEDQGFPPGTVGYDGTVLWRKDGGWVVHMPRDVAERIFKRAAR